MENTFQRKGNIINQQFMKFFFPTVLMTMAISMSTVVDGIIVGNILGSSALAAVNLVLPITLLFNSVYVLIGVGGSTLYSMALGEREDHHAKVIFTISILLLVATAFVVCVLGNIVCTPLAMALTSNAKDLTALVIDYLRVVVMICPVLIVTPGLVYFIRSTGNVRLASAVLITANVVNLTLDLVFMAVFDLGIGSAAVATGIGYIVGLMIALYGVYKSKGLRLCKFPLQSFKLLPSILSKGLPMTINTALNFFRMTCINLLVMIYLGSNGITAFSVCNSCLSIVGTFVGGSAQTMIPLIGTLFGERDFGGIHFTIKKAISITGIATLILFFIFEILPVQIVMMFGLSDAVQVALAVDALRIFAFSLPLTGLIFIFMCVYQIVGFQKMSSVIAFLEGFGFVVPLAFILAKLFGNTGIWLAFPAGEVLTLLTLLVFVWHKHKKFPNAKGFFLIDDSADGEILDVTTMQEELEAAKLSEQAIDFCKSHGVLQRTANRVGVVLEEMTVNTIRQQKNRKKKEYIDVRIVIEKDNITVIFKDNGYPLDPLKSDSERQLFDNITVAEAIADSVRYDYVIGMNCTIVKINLKGERENEYEYSTK